MLLIYQVVQKKPRNNSNNAMNLSDIPSPGATVSLASSSLNITRSFGDVNPWRICSKESCEQADDDLQQHFLRQVMRKSLYLDQNAKIMNGEESKDLECFKKNKDTCNDERGMTIISELGKLKKSVQSSYRRGKNVSIRQNAGAFQSKLERMQLVRSSCQEFMSAKNRVSPSYYKSEEIEKFPVADTLNRSLRTQLNSFTNVTENCRLATDDTINQLFVKMVTARID